MRHASSSRKDSIDADIVRAYRGWRYFEGRRFSEAFVHTKDAMEFSDRKEILETFMRLEKEVRGSSAEREFIRAKLIASQYYLRQVLGEHVPYAEYVLRTIGVPVRIIQERRIEALSRKIERKLGKLGIAYTERDMKKALYLKAMDEEAFMRSLEKEQIGLLKKASDYLGIDLKEKISIEFVKEDAYWHYRLSIRDDGFVLLVNAHPVRTRHKKGSLTYAIMHELCGHALQLGAWKREILAGRISEVCGCEEDYGPEIFSLEGVGESVAYYIFREDIDAHLEVELMLDMLEHMVQNNAYIRVNAGEPIRSVARYYKTRVIGKDMQSIMKTLREVKSDPLLRTYRYVYGASLLFYERVARTLSERNRRVFFREMYRRPMTYVQINAFYKSFFKKQKPRRT